MSWKNTGIRFLANKICIPTHEIFIPTTYLGDKCFDDSSSVQLVSSSSTTEDDKKTVETVNRDQAAIDKILPDCALNNTVSNHNCEKIVEVGSSYVINKSFH